MFYVLTDNINNQIIFLRPDHLFFFYCKTLPKIVIDRKYDVFLTAYSYKYRYIIYCIYNQCGTRGKRRGSGGRSSADLIEVRPEKSRYGYFSLEETMNVNTRYKDKYKRVDLLWDSSTAPQHRLCNRWTDSSSYSREGRLHYYFIASFKSMGVKE